MKILAVDSSAQVASVALCEDDVPVAHHFLNTKQTHSQTLLTMIDQMLANAKWNIADIDLFCVSHGPGSFTGVRIGVSLVKGLAFSTDTPCVAVSTLAALAQNVCDTGGVVCAVMDARNNQVYHALFACTRDGNRRMCDDQAISIDDLKQSLVGIEGLIYLVGDGAKLCFDQMREQLDVVLVAPHVRFQNALCVAELGHKQLLAGEGVSDSDLQVLYLRKSQAEREYEEKNKGI